MPSRVDWMNEGKFGLMVHWLAPGPRPKKGERLTDLNAAVDAFDLDRFMGDWRATGADWLIFTIGQATGYYASPNPVLDRFAGPGHCSRRDLVGEIARAVKAEGKRFIAYLPGDMLGQGQKVKEAFGWTDAEGTAQTVFQHRYTEFLAEYARRLGLLLDGWWIDGLYPWPIFHNSLLEGDRYLTALRAGNPQAAVALNDGSLCLGVSQPVVAGQDYLSGEAEVLTGGKVRFGRQPDSPLLDIAACEPQPPASCLWHCLLPIDCMWAHHNPLDPIQHFPTAIASPPQGQMEPPLYTTEDLHTLVRDFKAAGGGVTFNVGIFQEGGLGPATVAQLGELANRLE